MSLYADSPFPVAADIEAVHAAQIAGWGKPGTWGTGEQRLAVANEARRAGIAAGILEAPPAGAPRPTGLPDFVRDIIAQIAVRPQDIEHEFYAGALKSGLSDAEYVEIVGLVARIVDVDVFARGLGINLRPLPDAEPGDPTRIRPAMAVQELAWAPTIPNPPDGGAEAEELYDGHFKPWIMRAMSLVPAEYRFHIGLEMVQYLPLQHIMTYDYAHHDGLSRAQAELVAGRVSALNECFY